jgi:hypothetical protein
LIDARDTLTKFARQWALRAFISSWNRRYLIRASADWTGQLVRFNRVTVSIAEQNLIEPYPINLDNVPEYDVELVEEVLAEATPEPGSNQSTRSWIQLTRLDLQKLFRYTDESTTCVLRIEYPDQRPDIFVATDVKRASLTATIFQTFVIISGIYRVFGANM